MPGYGLSPYGLSPYGIGGLYPVVDKITIYNDSIYDNDNFTIGADVWIDPACDGSNILCKYSLADPEWYIGYSSGMLRFVGWDQNHTAAGISVVPDSYHGKWCRILLAHKLGHWNFLIDGVAVGTANTPLHHRNITSEDILSGMTGYIRDIVIWNGYASANDLAIFNAGGWVEQTATTDTDVMGIWPVDDDNGTILRDVSSHGNDGAITGTIQKWTNGADNLVFSAPTTYVSTEDAGRMSEQIIFGRDIHTESPSSIIIERTTEDPYRNDNYDSTLTIVDIIDDISGIILTFDKPFKTGLVNSITINDDLAATDLVPANITIPAGTEYSWSSEATDLDTYEAVKIVPQNGGFVVLFNTEIKSGNGDITGIDVAWADYKSKSVIIWTDTIGKQTVTVSNFTDLSGNIIPSSEMSVLIPSVSETIEYNGSQYTVKRKYKDTFADKISREARNYVE